MSIVIFLTTFRQFAVIFPTSFAGLVPRVHCAREVEVDEVMKTAYEDVKAFCESIYAVGGRVNCTIVPTSEQWSHQTTCELSYTAERLRWLFGR